LRLEALKVLTRVPGPDGTEILISLYDSVKETAPRTALVTALCARSGPAATAKVMAIAKTDPDSQIRATAVRRLAQVDVPPAPAAGAK
jgi:hypothetical protein